MYRQLNFAPATIPCPEGNITGGGNPFWGYRPDYVYHEEIVGKERPIHEIMGYYDLKTVLLGPFPGELFAEHVLTTKPHTTYITYHKRGTQSMYDSVDCSRLLPSQLMGAYKVVEALDPQQDIQVEDLQAADIEIGDIVLVRTDISAKYRDLYPTHDYYTKYPGLSFRAAEYLLEKGVRMVGMDVRNIEPLDPANRGSVSVVQLFNDAGVPVVQDLANLGKITANLRWVIVGVPIKLVGAIGGPARVIAVNPDNPLEYLDLSHKIKTYPSSRYDRKHGWMEPLPKRIDPREMQYDLSKCAKLVPFVLRGEDVRTPDGTSLEMYMYTHHGTNAHAESAFFDPCNVHNLSDELLCRYKEMPLDRLIAPACLINLSEIIGPRQTLDIDVLENLTVDIRKGDIAFIRTEINDWYQWGKSLDITPGLTRSAAKWFVDKGVRAVAIDFPTPERSNPPSGAPGVHYTANDVHYLWHKNDIVVIERVFRFGHIKKERFNVAILPFPAHNLGGFPSDVFGWESWN